MIEISNCKRTGHKRKADIKNIVIDKENEIIAVNYTISFFNTEEEDISYVLNPNKRKYNITSTRLKKLDPITGDKVNPEIDEVKGEIFPEGLINEYEFFSSLGWDHVLSINPEATKVVEDGNYGVAYYLLLRDDALGLV